jgi:transcriptional regulator with GAF, ATPase, and Fis domain
VKRRADLIDQFADLVVGADDPRRLAERTLEVVMSLTNGRSGAVFAYDGGRIALFASRGIDQHVLDGANSVWASQKETLKAGQAFYVPDVNSERRLPKSDGGGPVSFVMVPVMANDELSAVLYVDSHDPHFCTTQDLERLGKFSRIIAKAVGEDVKTVDRAPTRAEAWESYLERTPVEDMEREKLLLLLNRNEWNIARVARLMAVTRRTIYLRLQRYNIPRERVPKTRPRRATAS